MKHCETLLQARYIITQDAARTVLENAAVAIDHGRITDVGPRDAVAYHAETVRDLGDVMLLPGLVNAHTHAAMTFLRGVADDLPLLEWLEQKIFPLEAELTADIVRASALLGFAEMLSTGTTACQDMYLFEGDVLNAARTAGMRCLAGEVVFLFPSASCKDWRQGLELTRERARAFSGDERLSVSVCPHSVYTTDEEILRACRELAEKEGLRLHIHLAETRDETQRCLAAFNERPVARCERLGLLDVPCTLAHVVDVTDDELDVLASHPLVAVSHNPSSNMKLGSGTAPVPAMLDRGITVSLGTDGPASNNQLNMFTEMGRAALLHKTDGRPTATPAQNVLDMATVAGARALGMTEAGRIIKGAPADIIALDLKAPNMRPMYNPVSHAVYAATGHETVMTMVNGEILYDRGLFTRFDYAALCDEMDGICAFVRKKAGLI